MFYTVVSTSISSDGIINAAEHKARQEKFAMQKKERDSLLSRKQMWKKSSNACLIGSNYNAVA
jgi:hypothetical protein